MLENHLASDIYSICFLKICIQKFKYYQIKNYLLLNLCLWFPSSPSQSQCNTWFFKSFQR